jgi:hypothetical protein
MTYYTTQSNRYEEVDQIDLSSTVIPTASLGTWIDLIKLDDATFLLDHITYRSALDSAGALYTFQSTTGNSFLSLRLVNPNGDQQVVILNAQTITTTPAAITLTEFDTSRFALPGSKIQVMVTGQPISTTGGKLFIRVAFSTGDISPKVTLVLTA